MAPNASLPMLEPNCSASIGTGDRLALELLLGFTGMRRSLPGPINSTIRVNAVGCAKLTGSMLVWVRSTHC